MSEIALINKRLSREGYISDNFVVVVRNILLFRRVIVHQNRIRDLKKFFKEIKIPIRIRPIIYYPNYMESLFEKEINAITYKVVFIPKDIGILVSQIKEWANKADSYYRYRR